MIYFSLYIKCMMTFDTEKLGNDGKCGRQKEKLQHVLSTSLRFFNSKGFYSIICSVGFLPIPTLPSSLFTLFFLTAFFVKKIFSQSLDYAWNYTALQCFWVRIFKKFIKLNHILRKQLKKLQKHSQIQSQITESR